MIEKNHQAICLSSSIGTADNSAIFPQKRRACLALTLYYKSLNLPYKNRACLTPYYLFTTKIDKKPTLLEGVCLTPTK